MLRQEERATISIRSFGSLIRVTGRKAKIEEAQIDSILKELKQGNYEKLAEFEKLVDDLLNNILENIKVYAQRDENKKIEMIYQFLSDFFNYHLFDALDNETINEIKSAFDKDLNQLISDLRQEKRDERTIRHGRKPIHTMFKRMFRSNRSLDRQVMRDGRKEIGLENEEEGVRKSLKQLLLVLTKERSKLSKEQVKDLKNKARELLLRFAKIVLQEFEAIHEAEVDVETQEADLIAEIQEVMKKAKGNQKVFAQLQAIITKIESHLKTDFYVARRMLNRAKALKQNVDGRFVQAEQGKKGIPLVTEFPDGTTVLNIKEKIFVFSPDFLLSKHGAGTARFGSKFKYVRTRSDLYKLLTRVIKSNIGKIKGDFIPIDFQEPGTDSLISLEEVPKFGHREIVQNYMNSGFDINIVKTKKTPPESHQDEAHLKIATFNNRFYPHVEKDFFTKYNKNINEFEGVFGILTCFPGKDAPRFDNKSFWEKHALLQEG